MGKSYDLTEWDREDYVQDAADEIGWLVQALEDLGQHGLVDVARSLRARISLRLSDVMDEEDDQ